MKCAYITDGAYGLHCMNDALPDSNFCAGHTPFRIATPRKRVAIPAPVAAIITGALGALSVHLLGGPTWAVFGLGWLGLLVTLWGH